MKDLNAMEKITLAQVGFLHLPQVEELEAENEFLEAFEVIHGELLGVNEALEVLCYVSGFRKEAEKQGEESYRAMMRKEIDQQFEAYGDKVENVKYLYGLLAYEGKTANDIVTCAKEGKQA